MSDLRRTRRRTPAVERDSRQPGDLDNQPDAQQDGIAEPTDEASAGPVTAGSEGLAGLLATRESRAVGHSFGQVRVYPGVRDLPSAPPPGFHALGSQQLPEPSESEIGSAVEQARARSGSGTPLSEADREPMERSLGHDFSGVRVHADTGAADLTSTVGAQAATIGQDIYVAPDQYHPGTSEYRQLLGHEASHVAQTGGRVGSGSLVGAYDSPNERQARQDADSVAAGEPVGATQVSTAPRVQLMSPFPTDATAVTWTQQLDPSPILDWCNAVGNAGDTPLWTMSGLEAEVRSIFGGQFFRSGNNSWSSAERVINPGFWSPNYGVRVMISLFEDNVQQAGAGPTATVGSQGSAGQTLGSSTSTSTQVSGSGSTSGGQKDVVNVGGSAGGQTTTSAGESGAVTQGAQSTGAQQSQTARYTSTVYARVQLNFRPFNFLGNMDAYSLESGTYQVGAATYTRPTLQAPVAAPGTPT